MQAALVEFAVATAPLLRLAPPGRYITPVVDHAVSGATFSVALHRIERWPNRPPFSVTHVVGSTLEVQREARLQEACERKFPKLAAWQAKANARTVLVLEQNDIQLTNPEVVWAAYEKTEQGFADRPDEVWLVMTVVDDLWWGVPLRIDDRDYYSTSIEDRWPEYAPSTLEDLSATVRRRR